MVVGSFLTIIPELLSLKLKWRVGTFHMYHKDSFLGKFHLVVSKGVCSFCHGVVVPKVASDCSTLIALPCIFVWVSDSPILI